MDGRDRQGRWVYELKARGKARPMRPVRQEIEARLPEPLARVQERKQAEREQMEALLRESGTAEQS